MRVAGEGRGLGTTERAVMSSCGAWSGPPHRESDGSACVCICNRQTQAVQGITVKIHLNCGSSLGHHCELLGDQFFSCLALAVREIFLDLWTQLEGERGVYKTQNNEENT